MNQKKNDKVKQWRELLLSNHFQEIFDKSMSARIACERMVDLSRAWNKPNQDGSSVKNMTVSELQEFEAVLYVLKVTFSRIEEALNSAESATFDETLNT